MKANKPKAFEKLGRFVAKRKVIVILVWLVLLGVFLPFALGTSGVVSLQINSAKGSQLESVQADDLISSQFSGTVPNSTLVLVVSAQDVASLQTQQLISQLASDISCNSSIHGIENITSVYSVLESMINQTNDGVYVALDNANLTYSMLYGVPVAYLNVWSGAYNETQSSLSAGLNQTNQGVYTILDNANMTYNLLYSVPAMYLNVWSQAYSQTQNVSMSNDIANSQTAALLNQTDPVSFGLYTSQLLYAFNAGWSMSFQDTSTQQFTPVQRASYVADLTNQQYINNFLGSNASMRDFTIALTHTFSLNDFLTNDQSRNNAELKDFAVEYVANSSGSSFEFVNAAYGVGRNPGANALTTLTDDIIWNPETYRMGQEFIPMFNDVAYNQTAILLREADASSFDQYTSHLLDIFDAAWSSTFEDSASHYTHTQRALLVCDEANQQFINGFLNDNSTTRDFALAVANSFSLQDFLDNSQAQNNVGLQDFAIEYVSNSSGLSSELVTAIYAIGENPDLAAVRGLAGGIVSNPQAYNVGEEFDALITSLVSPSRDVTLLSVSFSQSSDQNLVLIRDIIRADLAQNPEGASQIQVTGLSAINYDFNQSTAQDLELILPVTIILLVVATGLFFRSLVTPLVTLGAIGISLGISQVFILLVGTYISNVDFTIPTILITIIVGVGTDYGIFVIARHREEMVQGLQVKDAIVKSVTWAGESIATSGATVIISFLALSATSIVLLQTMGMVVGGGVVVALLVALTFVPAMAMILGERLFWPNSGERFKKYATASLQNAQKRRGYFARSGALSVKHAKVIIVVAVLITLPLFYVYANTTPTYDFLGGAAGNLDSISASKSLSASFGGGKLFPTYVVVTFSQPVVTVDGFNSAEMSTLQDISSQIANSDGIAKVTGPTMPYGSSIDYANLNASATEDLTVGAVLQCIGADNKTALITVEFQADPYSNQAIDQAQIIRSDLHANFDSAEGVTNIYLGGTTGSTLDTKNLFTDQFNMVLPIVAIGVAIVLLIVLRSLILPLFAVVSVLMSIVWTLAFTAVVFQSAFNYGLLFIAPLFLFVTLLGLGMDYNIFILTRIREESSKGQKLNDAIVHAIEQTGGIITAAAIILAGSLGALMLSSDLLLKEIGFAFSVSILVDALLVRTYLVPAVMSVLGKWNWYNPLARKPKTTT